MVFLLAIAGLAGDTALVSTLRGFSVDNDGAPGADLGLLREPHQRAGREIAGNAPHPPPGWLPFGGEVTGIVNELPTYLRWEMKPNLDIRWNGTSFKTNSLGYRTPEVSPKKPAGTYRIVVFGSSNTMGYGVNTDDVYTRHLERFLNGWSGPSCRVEVVNLAVAGDSPTRRLARMRKEAATVERRLAVVRRIRSRPMAGRQPHSFGAQARHFDSVPLRPRSHPPLECRRRPTRSRSSATSCGARRSNCCASVYAAWKAEAARLQIPFTVLILPRGTARRSRTAFSRCFARSRSRTGSTLSTCRAHSIAWKSTSSASPTGTGIPTRGAIRSCSRLFATPFCAGDNCQASHAPRRFLTNADHWQAGLPRPNGPASARRLINQTSLESSLARTDDFAQDAGPFFLGFLRTAGAA